MKSSFFNFIFVVLFSAILLSCSNETAKPQSSHIIASSNNSATDECKNIVSYLKENDVKTIEDALNIIENLYDECPGSRSSNALAQEYIPSAAVSKTLKDFETVSINDEDTYLDVSEKYIDVVNNNRIQLTQEEYEALTNSVDISFITMQYALELEAQGDITPEEITLRTKALARCLAGIIGEAGIGFLAGSAVGTVTLPVVGTVSGAGLGAFCGALIGFASFC